MSFYVTGRAVSLVRSKTQNDAIYGIYGSMFIDFLIIKPKTYTITHVYNELIRLATAELQWRSLFCVNKF